MAEERPVDTIAAIATPPGQGGIAVVRVSGPDARGVALDLLRLDPCDLVERSIRLARVHCGERVLDEVLALWMPGPHSYTREDVLELQCHGGQVVARVVLAAVLGGGVRLADPGEFTLRAFLNGRLDLIQAEAVADVIAARTEAALVVHEELLRGGLSRDVEGWQGRLADVLAAVEAELEFAEDGEVGAFSPGRCGDELAALAREMAQRVDSYQWGRLSREGFAVALVGAPNTGKSSLLNALAREERAIVSATPGTTRDAIDVWVNALGVGIHLTDTAGLRATQDGVEGEGVARARRAAEQADLVVFVSDGSRALRPEERDEALTFVATGRAVGVVNKTDLGRHSAGALAELFGVTPVEVSARTGEGLPALLALCRDRAWGGGSGPGTVAPLTRQRHQKALAGAGEAVGRAIAVLEQGGEFLELAASDLHAARRHLAGLVGQGSPDDLLDRIFGSFCIGK